MPTRSVYQAEVQHLGVLDEHGRLDEELADQVRDLLPDDKVVDIFRQMIVVRELDDAAYRLQRSGRMGTYPQGKGQEAISFGTQLALKKGHDRIVASYRENAALFQHGLPMHYVLLHWMGDERGNAVPEHVAVSPICLAIGAQCLHAAGWAWAFKLQNQKNGTDKVVACYFGDGATSQGDFHEAMNFASVMKTPLVFVCQNNGWAISVPTSKQSNSKTFAQKAIAYDMPTIQVDGNDLFAVTLATRQAAERARNGEGPQFIEALTYRLANHTTADDAGRYRPEGELEAALPRDPFVRLRLYLEARGLWDDARQGEAEERARKIVREVVEVASGIAPPPTDAMFDHVYDTLPPGLIEQRETLCTASLLQRPRQERLREVAPESQRREGAKAGRKEGELVTENK